jgi:hypothetical protein
LTYAVPGGDFRLYTAGEIGYLREEVIIMDSGKLTPEEVKLFNELQNSTQEQLLTRVRNGNNKLMDHFAQIQAEKDNATWEKMLDNHHALVERLSFICDFLVSKGYHDCLYVENGVRTRTCLNSRNDYIVCWVCPSTTAYWSTELFGVDEKQVYVPGRHGKKTMEFLKALGVQDGKTSGVN